MISELPFSEIRERISRNMHHFYKLGIENVGVFKHVMHYGNDIEIYVVFDPKDPSLKYFTFEGLIENLFPGYSIGFFSKEDIDFMYYETVMCSLYFFGN